MTWQELVDWLDAKVYSEGDVFHPGTSAHTVTMGAGRSSAFSDVLRKVLDEHPECHLPSRRAS